ncbi:MAG: hypothetical protein JNK16_13540 [Phycisphaerales bacterium]|nr:hypothetical protein [Phycisphaerales bacterium]
MCTSPFNPQFSPSPTDFAAIMRDLCDPELSLLQVAERQQTPLAALIAWLATPEISAQLDQYESACARRTSLIVAELLPTLVESVRTIVSDLQAEEEVLARSPDSAATTAARRSARSMVLTGIRILMRFATLGRVAQTKAKPPARRRAALESVAAGEHRERSPVSP